VVIATALRKSSPERTFESLYKQHAADVYRYARALLPRQADAEDATQTTFMNAYRALERGERPRDAGPWLRAIALNVCREHHRRAGRRPAEVPLEEDPAELVLDPPTPTIRDIVQGLSQLPFNQRAAIVMREFEGRSIAEVGDALELSPSAVEALLFRARRALREQLDDQLTCGEAEQAISRQLDRALPRRERGPLRAHLRSCSECAALARRLRAQRSAVRSLALLPIPATLKLSRFFKGGAASASAAGAGGAMSGAGGSVIAGLVGSAAAKVAVVTMLGAAAVGVGYESLETTRSHAATTPPQSGAAPRTVTSASASAVDATERTPASQTGSAAGAHHQSASAAGRSHGTRHSSAVDRTGRGLHSGSTTSGRGHPAHHSASTTQATSNPGRGQGATKTTTSPGQSGVAHGSGHAYGHAKPEQVTPPAHAYGHTKPKKSQTVTTPVAAPVTEPPGQAKLPGTPATGKAKGQLKR
jgi:RNA polymerase sigma factor (sigma-70 family)